MQSRLVLASLLVVVLTVLIGYLAGTEAASTERPYEFGFTIEQQQHRHEKKDERGIVMGEFGFITADGIYHVTVYATDEEGKFRILAMRSYPYEEHPKTIEMIVRPKPKPTTPKAIAAPATTTTKPKPFEKHNFSVQGCSGCFIKNNAPTTKTQKPDDKKYDISLLSKPLAPEQTPFIGKQIVAQVLPQVMQVETKLKQTAINVQPRVATTIGSEINLALSKKNTQKQTTQSAHTTLPIAQHTATLSGKPVAGLSTHANPHLTTQQKAQATINIQQNLPHHSTQTHTKTKPLEAQNTNGNRVSPALVPNKAHTITQKPQLTPPRKPSETLSTNANHLSLAVAPNVARSALPSSTLSGDKAKTPTTGAFGSANSPQTPAKTGTNAFSNIPSNQPSDGAKGSTNSISPPNTQITPPALSAGNIGGGKVNTAGAANQPGTNTGFGGGSGGNSGSGAASGSKTANDASFGGSAGSKAGNAAGFGGSGGGKVGNAAGFGGSTGGKAGNAAGFGGSARSNDGSAAGFGGSAGSKAGNAAGFGGSAGSKAGNAAGFGGSAGGKTGNAASFGGSTGNKAGNAAGFDASARNNAGNAAGLGGGSAGSKTGSAAGEAGDLYRFKYLLDYNGHRETGSHSGNKEGSFFAIGDDNVERTIEYIANEFGYQPRVRFRKLDAPVPAKENTLKDYEFVWFKKL